MSMFRDNMGVVRRILGLRQRALVSSSSSMLSQFGYEVVPLRRGSYIIVTTTDLPESLSADYTYDHRVSNFAERAAALLGFKTTGRILSDGIEELYDTVSRTTVDCELVVSRIDVQNRCGLSLASLVVFANVRDLFDNNIGEEGV